MPYQRNPNNNVPYSNNYWKINEPYGSLTFWRTQSKLQTFYSPNFLLKKSGDFIAGDYMRMVGRTNDFGSALVQYSIKIGNPASWSTNYVLYYIETSDFDYTYDDGPSNNPAVATSEATSALDSTYRSKYELVGSLYVSYSTNENSIPTNSIPGLDYPFYNMASSSSPDASNNDFMEWGAETQLVSFDQTVGTPDTSRIFDNAFLRLPVYLTSYERYLSGQYGGWLRSSRYNNEYILTNHFQPWDKNNPQTGLITNAVYGGDTYVNYFDWQRTNPNYGS
jgi:hypothetical protein